MAFPFLNHLTRCNGGFWIFHHRTVHLDSALLYLATRLCFRGYEAGCYERIRDCHTLLCLERGDVVGDFSALMHARKVRVGILGFMLAH